MDQTTAVRPNPRRSLVYRMGKRVRPVIDRALSAYSAVGDAAVMSPQLFPWTAILEHRWEAIRDEARAALTDLNAAPPLHDVSPDHRRIAEPDRWRSFFLYGYGYRMEENCRACPQTAGLLAQIPELNSAFFSILKPGAHIPRHRGVTKAILTCHLGLQTPATGRCEMTVGDQTVQWSNAGPWCSTTPITTRSGTRPTRCASCS